MHTNNKNKITNFSEREMSHAYALIRRTHKSEYDVLLIIFITNILDYLYIQHITVLGYYFFFYQPKILLVGNKQRILNVNELIAYYAKIDVRIPLFFKLPQDNIGLMDQNLTGYTLYIIYFRIIFTCTYFYRDLHSKGVAKSPGGNVEPIYTPCYAVRQKTNDLSDLGPHGVTRIVD